MSSPSPKKYEFFPSFSPPRRGPRTGVFFFFEWLLAPRAPSEGRRPSPLLGGQCPPARSRSRALRVRKRLFRAPVDYLFGTSRAERKSPVGNAGVRLRRELTSSVRHRSREVQAILIRSKGGVAVAKFTRASHLCAVKKSGEEQPDPGMPLPRTNVLRRLRYFAASAFAFSDFAAASRRLISRLPAPRRAAS